MKLRWKVLFVILAAIVYWLAVQHLQAAGRCEGLKAWYDSYNAEYFNNALPTNTIIDYSEHKFIAATSRTSDGTFKIAFNDVYVQDAMWAHILEIHEMCHVATWDEPKEHGKLWVKCMRRVNSMGAFTSTIIDAQKGNTHDD